MVYSSWRLLLLLGGLEPRSGPLCARAIAGGLMDAEMLKTSDLPDSPYWTGAQWHRDQRDRVNFETACYYTHEVEIPLGCQYNRSVKTEWKDVDSRVKERAALDQFYTLTEGDNWRYNDNWLQGDPCWDFWYGVTCDEHGHVIYLEMADNRLNGIIPGSITDLTSLLKLDLSSTAHVYMGHRNQDINKLTGAFPSIAKITRISEIEISGNEITDLPADLYKNAKSLRVLSAERNSIRKFPQQLGNFEHLHTLELGRNRIDEPLPASMGTLKNARIIQLEYNDIDGELPTSIQHMTMLENLDLSHNLKLKGDFPNTTVQGWTHMKYLSIFNTSLSGYVGTLCKDVPFCWQFMYDTHKDMTWATAEDAGNQLIAQVMADAREYCNKTPEKCVDGR